MKIATGEKPIRDIDVVVIGSGIGGASFAAGLAPSGARILILERGGRLLDSPETRDAAAIFQRNYFRTKEVWRNGQGEAFSPGNFYYVGGNSKMYGAVLMRYRAQDFGPRQFAEGQTPGWPFGYDELESWYGQAEALYQVRGALGQDPTEPEHSTPYAYPPTPDEPAIAQLRLRLAGQGLTPFSLPLGVDLARWLARGQTGWDGHPNADCGKMDAETCALANALSHVNVSLDTGARVTRLETDATGRRIVSLVYEQGGQTLRLAPKLVVLAAGAINSALLLLASANGAMPDGLANRSGQVGRNFMKHNGSAMMAIAPGPPNGLVYQKTIGFNDFYLDDGRDGPGLGNVQMLGKITSAILKSRLRYAPEALLSPLTRRSFDFYLMSEDLPFFDNRVFYDGAEVVLDRPVSSMDAQRRLIARMRQVLRAAGFPLVLWQLFDQQTISHQCGTLRMGLDPARAVVDAHGRAYDHDNLIVADASVLPTSAAVNPALTVAALALRAADYVRRERLAG